jgi:hypothetical protein
MPGTRQRFAQPFATFAIVLASCGGALTPARRVQDASHELSSSIRFGRMDLALERVGRAERERFAKRHAQWGTGIRILDCEVVGIAIREKDRADVSVAVGWQRVTESELRSTQIVQKWKDQNGNWVLEGEERTGGDFGLLGEQVAVVRPPSGQDVQFKSITIR